MQLTDILHATYQIGNTPFRTVPYPHLYIENVFSANFYRDLLKYFPSLELFDPLSKRGTKGYDKRFIFTFDDESLKKLNSEQYFFFDKFRNFFLDGNFKNFLLSKFQVLIQSRLKEENLKDVSFKDEMYFVRDLTQYKLGPHTDSRRKLITLLFYLPADDLLIASGTSIYIPKNLNFKCNGDQHHPFENFELFYTVPFKPNSLFAFFKSNISFHGVEDNNLKDGEERRLMLYDIYLDI